MKNLIITISRQYGSGGRKIGQQLAEELGIPFYDSEIIDLAAKESGLAADFIRGQEQQLTQSLLFSLVTNFTSNSSAFNPNMLSLSDQVYLAQAKAIRSLADKGPCVIVGRCADYILADYKPFRIFVYADMASKMARCRAKGPEHEHFSDKELRQHIQKVDKNRAAYYEFYTGQGWGDKLHYDLCVNTTNAEIKTMVPILAKMFQ